MRWRWLSFNRTCDSLSTFSEEHERSSLMGIRPKDKWRFWLCAKSPDFIRRRSFQRVPQQLQKGDTINRMKHRHSFFVHSSKQQQPSEDSLELIDGKTGKPSVLNIRHLKAAREWKITIDSEDLDVQVITTSSGFE